MARKTTAGKKMYGWELFPELVEKVRELAQTNHRSLQDEVEHALQRHLEAPPTVEVVVTTPPMPDATVQVQPPEPQARRPRGRPRKADQAEGVAQAKAPPAAEEDQGEGSPTRGRKPK